MTPTPASLVYYPDTRPGIRREKRGRGFSYIAPDGTRIARGAERLRIEALAVPPAYEQVWICPKPHGHLQATGLDARTRKQYRYHPDWTEFRAQKKFDTLAKFGHALPGIRRRISRALNLDAGEQEFAVAAVIAMMDRLSIRIGNPAYADENGTYGATTLQSKHLKLHDHDLHLDYVAKGNKKVRRKVGNRKLMRTLQKLHDLPGAELVTWLDAEGNPRAVSSDQVNAWLAEATGHDGLTAKTFRTWSGSVSALEPLPGGWPTRPPSRETPTSTPQSSHWPKRPTRCQKSPRQSRDCGSRNASFWRFSMRGNPDRAFSGGSPGGSSVKKYSGEVWRGKALPAGRSSAGAAHHGIATINPLFIVLTARWKTRLSDRLTDPRTDAIQT